MTLRIWEQAEWHGMARKGPKRKDPFTGYLQVNTKPNSDRLQKLDGRVPYFSGVMPTPAARFDDFGGMYRLYTGDAQKSLSKSNATYNYWACFKVDDYKTLPAITNPWIFGAGSGASTGCAWGIYLTPSGGDWYLRIHSQHAGGTETATSTGALVSGSWYWVAAQATGSNLVLNYYKDGSGSVVETEISESRTQDAYSGTFNLCVGADDLFQNWLLGGSVVFAALAGPTISLTPWIPVTAKTGSGWNCVFWVQDPRKTVEPALVEDETNTYTWRLEPRPFMKTVSYAKTSNNVFDSTGVVANGYHGHTLTTPGLDIFRQRTVIQFLVQKGGQGSILRSQDSTFEIFMDADDAEVQVFWPPADQSLGNDDYGRLLKATGPMSGSDLDDRWYAVEVIPNNTTGTENIKIYEYDTAGDSWTDRTSGGSAGSGILPIDTTKWVFCACGSNLKGKLEVSDFRIIVGDDNWANSWKEGALSSQVPPELLVWLNHDTGTTFPNHDRISTIADSFSGDVQAQTIAMSDRVDGTYRFRRDPYVSRGGFDGCPYITNGCLARVEDMIVSADGTITGVSDSYQFVDTDAYPQKQVLSDAKCELAEVGTHRYVVGAGPIQYVRDIARSVGWHRAWVDSHAFATAEASATLDYGGQLAWGADYKYLVTHYDPLTGDESNPYGPYRFTTTAAPSPLSSTYGSAGCAFHVTTFAYTPQNLGGQELRYYRYHDGDGTYYLEGHGKIGSQQFDGDSRLYWDSDFVFAMSDDDVSLAGIRVQYDNDSPPDHSSCFIWNGRAFYVDAVFPSRIWFSKPGQFGSVPGSNLLLTDEGSGGKILGFLPGFGGLLVLREKAIWIMPQFVTADQAFAQSFIPDVGCVSGSAAVFAEGVLWWASPGGIYSFDGENPPQGYGYISDGLDTKVWDHAPRQTVAYYDRTNWVVTFACDGSGVSLDVRTGALSLTSAPERSFANCATSSYTGPLYGADGMVWKDSRDDSHVNGSLSLDASGQESGIAQTMSVASVTALSWYWQEGAATGTVFMGVEAPNATSLTLGTSYSWLNATSAIGRNLTSWSADKTEIWSLPIHAYYGSPGTHSVLFRTQQTALSQYYIDRVPMYYRSQAVKLPRIREARIYERADFRTGILEEGVEYAASNADVAFFANVAGAQTVISASATGAFLEKADYILPLRLRGTEFYYEVEHTLARNMQPVEAVSVHFRITRPRGRTH